MDSVIVLKGLKILSHMDMLYMFSMHSMNQYVMV